MIQALSLAALRSWLRLIVLVAIAASAGAACAAAPWRVVIIRNWDSLYRVNLTREEGLRETLLENSPRDIEIYPEQIDNLRFQKEYNAETAAALQRQYRDIKVDVVIATGVEPLEFAETYRDRVWPDAAIVFMGVTDGWLEQWKRPPRTTGVTTVLDVAGTLELGLTLRPSARKLYLIAGTSEFDQRYLAQAKEIAKRFGRLEPHEIVGLSREQTIQATAHVPPDSLLLYLTILRDSEGLYGGPYNTILSRIAEVSPAPLLSAVNTQWNRGPVGGSSSLTIDHGRAGGRLVRRILEGADPDSIPVTATPAPSCEVDWRGLQRWSIPEHNVPSFCSVINRPVPIWRDYLWEVLALLAVIVLQFGLLWLLVAQSRERRKAQHQLRERENKLSRMGRLAAIGELVASIAHEVNQPIGSILSNAEAARMMLDQGALDHRKLREILDDICKEDLRAADVVQGVRRMFARGELSLAPTNVNERVAEALRRLALEAARVEVNIVPALAAGLPVVVADGLELEQLVANLVANAVDAMAANPEAGRSIRVQTRAAQGGVEIIVADDGPGFSTADAARVFESSFTTKKHGMGFGLPIVRTIAELHGGRVHYMPNVPHGAVFTVWLPAADSGGEASVPASA